MAAKKKAARKKATSKKKSAAKPKKRGARSRGRPAIEFDLTTVAKLGKIRAPYEIVAAKLGCSVDTVRNRMREDSPHFDDAFFQAYRTGVAERNIGLRTRQYQVAMTGNVPMLIHLGKNELDQTDSHHLTHANDPDNPVTDAKRVDLSKLTRKELIVLKSLLLKARPDELEP